jgi:hypothetical protein
MNYKGIDIQRPKEKSSLEVTQEQTRLFERLQNQPFWIWNIEEHKRDDIMANGECCCFNQIIGLPQKDGVDRPLYDYERIVFDHLITSLYDTKNGNSNFLATNICG